VKYIKPKEGTIRKCWLVQLYRLHFGNPEISPISYIFSPTGFTIGALIPISTGYFP